MSSKWISNYTTLLFWTIRNSTLLPPWEGDAATCTQQMYLDIRCQLVLCTHITLKLTSGIFCFFFSLSLKPNTKSVPKHWLTVITLIPANLPAALWVSLTSPAAFSLPQWMDAPVRKGHIWMKLANVFYLPAALVTTKGPPCRLERWFTKMESFGKRLF